MKHIGSFVYRILSLPLSTLVKNIHLKLQSFYLTSYNHCGPRFCLTKRCFIRSCHWVAIHKKQTELKNTHIPEICILNLFFLWKQKFNLSFKGGRDNQLKKAHAFIIKFNHRICQQHHLSDLYADKSKEKSHSKC